jgi:hypothetical protein
LLADAIPDLLGAIAGGQFDIAYTGLAQSFLLDCISRRRGTLKMSAALIFDGHQRPAALIDNKDVDSLAVD